jgi:hypothetical protein
MRNWHYGMTKRYAVQRKWRKTDEKTNRQMMSEIIGFEKKHWLRPKQKFPMMTDSEKQQINTIKKTDIKCDKVHLL